MILRSNDITRSEFDCPSRVRVLVLPQQTDRPRIGGLLQYLQREKDIGLVGVAWKSHCMSCNPPPTHPDPRLRQGASAVGDDRTLPAKW